MGWFLKTFLFVGTVLPASTTSENSLLSKTLSELVPLEDKLAECLLRIVDDARITEVLNIRFRIEAESEDNRRALTITAEKFIAKNDKVIIDLDFGESTIYLIHGRWYFVDSFQSLDLLIKRQREQDTDLSAEHQYFLIVLPPNISNPEGLLEQLFYVCLASHIVNVNILVEDVQGVVTLYTYYPMSEKSCTDTTPIIHNRFVNGSFESDKPFFLPKANNFRQCPIRVGLRHEPPFIILDQDRVSGLDGVLLETLAEIMNFSLKIVLTREGMGHVYSKDNATGGYAMLQNGAIDLMTSICTEKAHRFFAATNAFHYSYMLIIFKRLNAYSPLEILIFPFDWYTWFAVAILFLGKWLSQTLWNRIAVPRNEHSTRLCSISWFFVIFILSSSYAGSIFRFLHSRPHRPLPKNIDEALHQRYKFVVHPLFENFLRRVPELKNQIIHFQAYTPGDLGLLEGKYALIDSHDHLAFNKNISAWNEEYLAVQQPVFFLMECIHLPKFSYITQEIERRLGQLGLHGHLTKMNEMIVPAAKIWPKRIINTQAVKMSIHELMGIFQLYFALIGLSTCVFALELFSRNNRRLQMIIEWFHH